MESNILVRGKGVITKITFNSESGVIGFDGKKNKRTFIHILQDAANENVVLVAYCVLDYVAHVVVKTNQRSDVDRYVSAVNAAYARNYEGSTGNPIRSDYVSQKVDSDDLARTVAYVHKIAPARPSDYEFCSYNYLREGTHGGTNVIIAENGGSMTEKEFVAWLDSSVAVGKHVGTEKFSSVLKELSSCMGTGHVSEPVLVSSIADLCERCGATYKKAAKAFGINYKKRRDIKIAVLTELMKRGHSLSEGIVMMNLIDESQNNLLLDCIVEENRVHAYSYDHIAYSFGLDDYYYDILAEILRGLHRKYGYGFEELCLKFHLQNDILALRSKCGF